MIISHKHRFIFIRTEKTAGTSVEIALSKYCGPRDVITHIGPEDELIRKKLGYRGPQNYKVPFKNYSRADWMRMIRQRKRISFFNHAGAAFIRNHIDKNIWNSYFKFCIERNPWDKAVSWYYWRYDGKPRKPITQFIHSHELGLVKGFDLYTRSGEIVVDKIFRFEQLSLAMEEIRDRLGLTETPELPFAKATQRKDRRSYRDILSEEDRDKIAKVFEREIAYFDYQW